MKIDELDEKFLHGWHDQMFETSKRILRTEGHLRPYVWMLTDKERVAPAVRSKLMPMEPLSQSGKDELAIVCLPFDYNNDTLSRIIHDHVLTPEARERYDMAHLVGKKVPGFTEERFNETMVRTFIQSQRWVEADLIAVYIKAMLRLVGAVAYVKQDDAWWLDAKRFERGEYRTLADHPEALECIMSELEWRGGMRHITQPYHRRAGRRGEGKVKSFSDPVVNVTPRLNPEAGWNGRFCWMLPFDEPTQQPAGAA